jgi:KipI family sensor histidine kinase inhibitor
LKPRITPLGDSAITITFGDEISEELNECVVSETLRVRRARIPGVHDVVPSYAALGVHYDPSRISYTDLVARINSLPAVSQDRYVQDASQTHIIPVTYDGEDLAEVASRCGLSAEQVIEIHTSREYRVFVIGFVPGFAYLGRLDERLVLPRRDSPRKRVPAGSVAIAEAQTGIYPSATPGGWHLIGRTDVTMFDPRREKASLLAVGDRVRFIRS